MESAAAVLCRELSRRLPRLAARRRRLRSRQQRGRRARGGADARAARGIAVELFTLAGPGGVPRRSRGEPARRRARSAWSPIVARRRAEASPRCAARSAEADGVVDALFGTGLGRAARGRRPARGRSDQRGRAGRSSPRTSRRGSPPTAAPLRARRSARAVTVAFGAPKLCHVLAAGERPLRTRSSSPTSASRGRRSNGNARGVVAGRGVRRAAAAARAAARIAQGGLRTARDRRRLARQGRAPRSSRRAARCAAAPASSRSSAPSRSRPWSWRPCPRR